MADNPTQDALLLVFLVFLVVVRTVPVKLHLGISAVPAACLRRPRCGGNGTRRSILARSELPSQLRGEILSAYDFYRRFATASALAASAVPSLLFARGHHVSTVPEVPLVVSSSAFSGGALTKTSAALALLTAIGAIADCEKVKKSRKLRAGKGKLRGRRHRQRRGPLIVYNPDEDGKELVRAFRNIPGLETCSVFALNLLQLAPGGHLGRFIVWSSSAFAALDKIYGSTTEPSAMKKDFLLPSNVVRQPDIGKLINSSEVQSVLRAKKGGAITKRTVVQKKNPLVNKQVLLRLNPYASAFAKADLGHLKLKDGEPKRVEKEFKDLVHEN